jgi:hypothetical protein
MRTPQVHHSVELEATGCENYLHKSWPFSHFQSAKYENRTRCCAKNGVQAIGTLFLAPPLWSRPGAPAGGVTSVIGSVAAAL